MILSLIWEVKTASGYQLNAIIKNRGYRAWAEIGMTSIYSTLKKLERKGLVISHITTNKTTQGPAAKKFSLTDNALNLLKEETEKWLSETRERDRKFDLALSMIDLISIENALVPIKKRKVFLETEHTRLSNVYNSQKQAISFTGALLFKHTLQFIESEIAFLEQLISECKAEGDKV
jgi:DNA-binding PadR family transcriptional regulator